MLVPGQNTIQGYLHYAPPNPLFSDVLTEFLQRPAYGSSDPIPIVISGDGQSSPYASLIEALEGVTIAATFNGISARLVAEIAVKLDVVVAFCTDKFSIQFKVNLTP